LGTVFRNNSIITVFNEFYNFSSVTSTYETFSSSTIQEVTFPPNITNVGGYTFYRCSKLRKFILQDKVTSITGNTFQSSTGSIVVIYATNPPTISSQARSWLRGAIYVPDDSVEAYRTANEWSNIASRIVGISEYEE